MRRRGTHPATTCVHPYIAWRTIVICRLSELLNVSDTDSLQVVAWIFVKTCVRYYCDLLPCLDYQVSVSHHPLLTVLVELSGKASPFWGESRPQAKGMDHMACILCTNNGLHEEH
eukprot:TRINITY_DN17345_c1_g2_i3.p1 TRINITY_DN17345_c1_g2~~TRINITY_DN17345_c1_g2_i3.p1  ORF type:complete len:115 (-),score=11.43 TRINITY_DN17345_c1_g2_i3:277-621(-)